MGNYPISGVQRCWSLLVKNRKILIIIRVVLIIDFKTRQD